MALSGWDHYNLARVAAIGGMAGVTKAGAEMAEKRTILVCSCENTMSLDADAISRGCRGAQVKTASQLCRAEIERFRAAAAGGEPVTIGCTQEAPLFSEVAGEQSGAISFVNVRETAGWSKDAASAGPKMAALLAVAAEPLRPARRAFSAGMAALTDALISRAPPEKPIACVWPDAITVDHGLIGGAQFAWPDGPEDQPPDWLVFGGMIRTVSMAEGDPGLRPLSTAIEEEGFDEAGAAELVGSFARHLMVQFDAWQEFGFQEIAKSYLSRLAPEKGVRRDIDDNGDLLVRRMDKPDPERRPLVAALAKLSWYDPTARGPK